MKLLNKKLFLSFFILWFIGQSLPAQILTYGVFPAPPFIIIDNTKSPPTISGIDVEIMEEAAKRAGISLSFVPAPWARCLALAEAGKIDLISSVFKTPEREAFLTYFSKPYLSTLPISFYSLKVNRYSIRKYEDLRNIGKIGVLRQAKYFPQFDLDTTLEKYESTTQEQLYLMLLGKRIDVFAGYDPTENYFIKTNGYSGQVVKSEFSFAEPSAVYFACSKTSPQKASIQSLEQAFLQMEKEGKVRSIVTDHYNLYQ